MTGSEAQDAASLHSYLQDRYAHIAMTTKRKVSPPVPDGQAVYVLSSVTDIEHHKEAILKFARNRNPSLELERDTGNKKAPNAIKVIGLSKLLVFEDRDPIGYVSRELASCIVEGGFWGSVEARLRRIYVGQDEQTEIEFELLGPEEQKTSFNDLLREIGARKLEGRPATVWQKEFYRTFDLEVPKDLTYLAARRFISEKSAEIAKKDRNALRSWEWYGDIVKELLHPQTRETHGIEEVSITSLRSAVVALLDEGHSLEAMHRHIELVVDKLTERRPDTGTEEESQAPQVRAG